jgi:para-aminobenzoate synthetase/4-amino-4-deoxychorismate lyase
MGVFETLLVIDGSPVELEAHLDRLGASVRDLFGDELPLRTRDAMLERASALSVGRLRVTVAPGDQGGGVDATVVTATVDPLDVFPSWDRAIALHPFVVEGWLGAHKWADRDGLAAMEASLPERGLPLLVDAGAQVLEASRANVFAVEGKALITPPTDGRILPGLARAGAIEAGRSLGFEIRERPLSLDSLIAAGEAFLTGSVRGVEPVGSVAGSTFAPPSGTVKAIAAAMRQAWLGKPAAGAR